MAQRAASTSERVILAQLPYATCSLTVAALHDLVADAAHSQCLNRSWRPAAHSSIFPAPEPQLQSLPSRAGGGNVIERLSGSS